MSISCPLHICLLYLSRPVRSITHLLPVPYFYTMELDPIEIRLVLYYTLFLSFVLHNYGGQGHLNKLNLKEVFLYKQLSNCFCLETVLLVKGEVEQCFFTSPWRIFLSHCSRWQVSSDRRDAFKCMHYSQRRGHLFIT